MKLSVFISLLLPLVILGQNKFKLDESFDPTSLNDWSNSREQIEQIKSIKTYFAESGSRGDTTKLVEFASFVFRVQLGSTDDYDVAKEFEDRARRAFDEEILVQFDSPYYKIRVGKMNNREDAQRLQEYAMENGYRRAWVIRTENTPEKEK